MKNKVTRVQEQYSIDIWDVGFTLTHNLEAPEYWQITIDIQCNRTLEEHIEAFEWLILELKKL